MRKNGIGTALVAAVLVFATTAATAPSNEDELLKDELHFLQQSGKTYSGGRKAAQARNMEVVGQNDLGGRGFNADVWVHEGYAYVGHWGFSDWASGSKTRFCPSPPRNGVASLATPVRRRSYTITGTTTATQQRRTRALRPPLRSRSQAKG